MLLTADCVRNFGAATSREYYYIVLVYFLRANSAKLILSVAKCAHYGEYLHQLQADLTSGYFACLSRTCEDLRSQRLASVMQAESI